MGLLTKIALEFDGARFDLPVGGWLARDNPDGRAMYFLCWPLESNLLIGFAGGDLAWELTGMGQSEAISFARAALRDMLGSRIDGHFRKGVMTDWGENPFTFGAYAGALPGHHTARESAARPIAKRLFFAGEAMAGPYAQTCGGAFMSGRDTAFSVARAIST